MRPVLGAEARDGVYDGVERVVPAMWFAWFEVPVTCCPEAVCPPLAAGDTVRLVQLPGETPWFPVL